MLYSGPGNEARVLGGGFIAEARRDRAMESRIADVIATARMQAA